MGAGLDRGPRRALGQIDPSQFAKEGVMIRTFRNRESGMSAIPFVVSMFLVVGFAIAWYSADQDAVKLKDQLQKEKANNAAKTAEHEQLNSRLNDLTPVTGFGDVGGKPDKAAIEAALQSALDKWREKLTIEFTADKYSATGTGGAVEKLAGDKVRVVYLPAKDQISSPSVQTVLPILEAGVARLLNDVKRYVESNAAAVSAKAAAEKAFGEAVAAKDAANAQTRQEMETGFRTRDESIRELRDAVQAKDQAITQAQSELEAVRADSSKSLAAMASDLNQKKAELQTINRREQPFVAEGPDGEVLAAGAGVVVVNRGKKDMLMPGTMFKVLGRIKGGDLVLKGAVKVSVCHDGTAECRIVDQDVNDPIGQGDLIQSETYSPNRVMRFVLIGEFKKMGRSQAEARLKALGAQVDAAVTPETHYLVIGSSPAGENIEESDAAKNARTYGVTPLTESQLASFTLY